MPDSADALDRFIRFGAAGFQPSQSNLAPVKGPFFIWR